MGEDDFRALCINVSATLIVSEGSTILMNLGEPHYCPKMPDRFEIYVLYGALHNAILSTLNFVM